MEINIHNSKCIIERLPSIQSCMLYHNNNNYYPQYNRRVNAAIHHASSNEHHIGKPRSRFSEYEDNIIREGVAHKLTWGQISERLPHRKRATCFNRYRTLQGVRKTRKNSHSTDNSPLSEVATLDHMDKYYSPQYMMKVDDMLYNNPYSPSNSYASEISSDVSSDEDYPLSPLCHRYS